MADIVERLRARIGDSGFGRPTWAPDVLCGKAARDIERLRAANKRLTARNERLQAVIDAYAAADRAVFDAAMGSPERATAYAELEQALVALSAAATKEDDRG